MSPNIVAQCAWPVPKQMGQGFADCLRFPQSKAHMKDSLDQNLRWRQATPKEMEKICRDAGWLVVNSVRERIGKYARDLGEGKRLPVR